MDSPTSRDLFICQDQPTANAVVTALPGADTIIDSLNGEAATSIRGRTVVAVLRDPLDAKAPVPEPAREWAAHALERGCTPFVAALPCSLGATGTPPENWAQLVEADSDQAAFCLTTGRRPALEPDYPDTARDLHEAERLLEIEIDHWATAIARHDRGERKTAPQTAALVSVGVGKSERALRLIANHPALRGKRIAYFLPNHKLAEELVDRYRQIAGPDSPAPIHWKGRTHPGMCQRPTLIEELTRAGMPVKQNACLRRIPNGQYAECPFYVRCAFIRLEAEADKLRDDTRGAVAFLPHNFLGMAASAGPFKPRDGEDRAPIEVAIIDESFWGGMIPCRPSALLLDTLCELRSVPAAKRSIEPMDLPEDGEVPEPDLIDAAATSALADASQTIRDLATSGKLSLTALAEAGFDRASLRKLRDYERRIDIRLKLDPSAPDEAGMAAIRARSLESRKCKARARFWEVLASEIEQADRREVPKGADAAPLNCARVQPDSTGRYVLLLHWAREIKAFDPWQTPTLMLDATADVRVLRRFFPELRSRDVATIRARDLKAEVIQVANTGLGKTSIVDHPSGKPDDLKRRDKRRRNIAALARCLSRTLERAAVVANLELEEQLLVELGRQIDPTTAALASKLAGYSDTPAEDALAELACCLPIDVTGRNAKSAAKDVLRAIAADARIELGHFNALRGLDHWRDVPAMIIAGRPQASPEAVDHLARALFGPGTATIKREDAGIAHRVGVLRMRNGRPQVVRYSDCIGELQRVVMRQVREAELVQAIGRARLARREGRSRCIVYLLTNVPIDMTIDRAAKLADLMPNRLALSVLETGVHIRSKSDQARLFPHLWPSNEASKKAGQREKKAEESTFKTEHSQLLVRGMMGPDPLCVCYRRAGQGQRPAKAVLPRQAAGMEREILETLFGEQLAMVDIDDGAEENEGQEAA